MSAMFATCRNRTNQGLAWLVVVTAAVRSEHSPGAGLAWLEVATAAFSSGLGFAWLVAATVAFYSKH